MSLALYFSNWSNIICYFNICLQHVLPGGECTTFIWEKQNKTDIGRKFTEKSPKNMQHLKKRMLYLTLTSYWEVKRKTYFWSLKFFFKDKTVFQQLVA